MVGGMLEVGGIEEGSWVKVEVVEMVGGIEEVGWVKVLRGWGWIICGFPDNCDTLDELMLGMEFKKVIEFNYEIKKSCGKYWIKAYDELWLNIKLCVMKYEGWIKLWIKLCVMYDEIL